MVVPRGPEVKPLFAVGDLVTEGFSSCVSLRIDRPTFRFDKTIKTGKGWIGVVVQCVPGDVFAGDRSPFWCLIFTGGSVGYAHESWLSSI